MKMFIFVGIIVVILLIIKMKQGLEYGEKSAKTPAKKDYLYTKKSCIMSTSELSFYKTLHEAVNGCVIIPQAHISMFLDHQVKGQNWNAALSRINSKSIDFLICTNDMEPLVAIELDDYTHNQPNRKTRDEFVNSIIIKANIPMLRFKVGEWNSDIIKHRITQALS